MSATLLLVAAFVATQVNTYEYDELGRLIAERSGAEGKLVARYAYDAAGRKVEITNGKGGDDQAELRRSGTRRDIDGSDGRRHEVHL